MTDEAIRIAIAEAVGWRRDPSSCGVWFNPLGVRYKAWLPHFESDLNAIHEAEGTCFASLTESERERFLDFLYEICNDDSDSMLDDAWNMIRATARQRAEAFLKVTGKWEKS